MDSATKTKEEVAKRHRTVLELPPIPSASRALEESLRTELEDARAALEHERTLRALDKRRFEGVESRLKRQMEIIIEEGDEVRVLLDDVRASGEAECRRMADARRETQEKLRVAEERIMELENRKQQDEDLSEDRGGSSSLLQKKNQLLQRRLDGMEGEAQSLRNRMKEAEARAIASERALADAKLDIAPDSEKKSLRIGDEIGNISSCEGGVDDNSISSPKPNKQNRPSPASPLLLSPAPPAVMTELNRTRLKLADSERINRQLSRRLEDLKEKADQSVRNREAAKSTQDRLEILDIELSSLRRQREASKEIERRWRGFGVELRGYFQSVIENSDVPAIMSTTDENTPPEVATVLRHFSSLKEKVQSLENDVHAKRLEALSKQKRIESLERQKKELESQLGTCTEEKRKAEEQANTSDLELRKLQSQEAIWKKEADSMRLLLNTYEAQLGEKPKPKKAPASPKMRGLEVSLESARKRTESERAAHRNEQERRQKDMNDLRAEHERVLEKFGKLRDALHQEREKAGKAEERAAAAETLAGKGSFNPDSTKVLHLSKNPSMDAMRAKYEKEISLFEDLLAAKDREIAEATGGNAKPAVSSSSTAGPGMNSIEAKKLHQRLKENFKEQIALFREGVYLLTGYKVDMFAEDTTKPRYRVRSVYAEREEDDMMYVWPRKKKEGGAGSDGLDLMDTPWAKEMAQTDSFQYMTKFNSVPGFMASVQLSLFERQTFVT